MKTVCIQVLVFVSSICVGHFAAKALRGNVFGPKFKAGDCVTLEEYAEMPAEVRAVEKFYITKIHRVVDSYYLTEQWDREYGWYGNRSAQRASFWTDRVLEKIECPAEGSN